MPVAANQPSQRDLPLLAAGLILLSLIIGLAGFSVGVLFHAEQGDMSWSFRPSGLGNYLQSPLAWVYNAALIWAGLWLCLAMVTLAYMRPRLPDLLLPLGGGLIALMVMLMGVFPNHYGSTHTLLAISFTLTMALTHAMVLGSAIRWRLYYASPLLYGLSLLGLGCALPILLQTDWLTMAIPRCEPSAEVCTIDMLLWLQLAAVKLWVLVLGISIYRKPHRKQG